MGRCWRLPLARSGKTLNSALSAGWLRAGGDASWCGSGLAAGGSRVDAMRDANMHGICALKRGPTQIRTEGCRRRHPVRAVVALRAALASPAGLLLQTIQTP